MENFAEIRNIFTSGKLPVAISDSPYLLNKFTNLGFNTLSIHDVCNGLIEAPDEVILIPVASAEHPNIKLHNALKRSSVLLIPMLAFSSSQHSIDYLVLRLIQLNFTNACEKSRLMVEFIQQLKTPMSVISPECNLTIELGQNVRIFAPKLKPNISSGEWISIIQFLEVGLIPNEEYNAFNVNGSLLCSGVSIAHHLHAHFTSGPIADEVWDYLNQLRLDKKFPLKLDVNDSEVVSIKTRNGENILENIKPFTDHMLYGRLTEVGFGSLEPSDATDWSINSQLNEPSGGVHLALGAGEKAAHIDFISPYAKIANFF